MQIHFIISHNFGAYFLELYEDGEYDSLLIFDTFEEALEAKRAWAALAKGGGLNE